MISHLTQGGADPDGSAPPWAGMSCPVGALVAPRFMANPTFYHKTLHITKLYDFFSQKRQVVENGHKFIIPPLAAIPLRLTVLAHKAA